MGYVGDDDEQEESQWSYLPQDILELILRRLCLMDYLQCRAVCCSWRTTVANAIATKHCSPALQLPLLLLEYITRYSEDPSFFSLTKHNAVLHPKRQLYTATQDCVGTIEGWLMMIDEALMNLEGQERTRTQTVEADSSPYFLFNPVTGERIVLQYDFCLPPHLADQYLSVFYKMVASSVPSSPDCTVVGLAGDATYFAFYRLADEQWNVIEADKAARKLFSDIEFHQGKLYVVIKQRMDSIMVYDLQYNGLKPEVLVPLEPKPANYLPLPQPRAHREGDIVHVVNGELSQLVNESDSGELFLIARVSDCAYDINTGHRVGGVILLSKYAIPPRIKEFRVFKLDKSSGRGSQWEEVNDLGDRLFFVSRVGSKVISYASLNSSDQQIVKRNCIYFAYDYECSPASEKVKIGIFSLNDKSIQVLDPPPSANRLSCLWFTPSL